MQNIIKLKTPLSKSDIKNLNIGDIVELTGTIYTARDAAHKLIQNEFENNLPQKIDFYNQLIFYAGPCPTKPGRAIGSVAPTTSIRMDIYVEMMFKLGIVGLIGKGERNDYVADLCKEYESVYFLSHGGAAAIISDQIKSCEVVAYDELQTESIKKLEVDCLKLIVGIDTKGLVFQDEEIKKYRKTK